MKNNSLLLSSNLCNRPGWNEETPPVSNATYMLTFVLGITYCTMCLWTVREDDNYSLFEITKEAVTYHCHLKSLLSYTTSS